MMYIVYCAIDMYQRHVLILTLHLQFLISNTDIIIVSYIVIILGVNGPSEKHAML